MLVAIVDYQSGNLHSAAKAFERAARESGIAAEISVTSDPGTVGARTASCCRAWELSAIATGALRARPE